MDVNLAAMAHHPLTRPGRECSTVEVTEVTERLLALRLLGPNSMAYLRQSTELRLEGQLPMVAGRGQTSEPVPEMMMAQGLNSPS